MRFYHKYCGQSTELVNVSNPAFRHLIFALILENENHSI